MKWQEEQIRIHKAILFQMAKAIATIKKHYVLKGGTALMFGRGLNRFSTDLDYDTSKKLAMEGIIKETFHKISTDILDLKRIKDIGVNQKFVIRYRTPTGFQEVVKIETRILPEIDMSKTETTPDGLLIYNTTHQLRQKIFTANARGNRAPRDLFDIDFLASKFPEAALNNAEELIKFGEDITRLQHIYKDAWKKDDILSQHSIANTILRIGIITEKLKETTGPKIEEDKPGIRMGFN
jgi:hypothetical protein